jgi:glutaredoxin
MIRIYTSDNCEYCKELKEKLEKENIKFFDVNVDEDKNKDECKKIFKFVNEPVIPIIIKKPHVLVPKKSFHTIDQAIHLIKSID